MKLNLREIIAIPGSSVDFACELETEGLDFPSVLRYVSAPYAQGCVFNEAGVLRLEGEIRTDMLCVCDRCAGEFETEKLTPLSAVIVEQNDDNADDPELFFLDGDEIDLGEILSTLFILDMDTKFLCREDCRGLCPKCGRNLNLGPCGCGKETDPRFAVLEQLLDKDPGEL
ncbi:MAG: DUF177 domain-containing protein [Oscillospiraceae bacterium]|nr:DUF177 domain-containing protein [Oscillospiraceae bacterium]